MLKSIFTALALALLFSTPAIAKEAPERADIPDEYKWDLSSMYASADAWEADVGKFQEMLPKIAAFKGKLGQDGETLLAAVKTMESVESVIADLFVYAGLKSYEDMRAGEHTARFSRAQSLYGQYQEATAFVLPELMEVPEEKLQQMIAETKGLKIYEHNFDEMLRLRNYTLSEREEEILAAASDPLSKYTRVFGAFDNADVSFGTIANEEGEEVELTQARYGAFLVSSDRRVREDAWKSLFTEYEKLGNTLAANFEGHIKSMAFLAKVRGYESALHASTYGSAIPIEVYENLVSVTKEGARPLQRFLELRRQILDVDTLEVWDLYAPISEPTIKDLPFEEAKTLVADALTPLGDEYVAVYWKGFEEGWVDALESKGKRSGAYSWGTYTSKPYLSMNYEGTLGDVTTLAHEYGHSIHSYLTRNTQPYTYGGYTTFIAEVASMTNEAILYQKMLASADTREEKLFLLQSYLDDFRGSFYRQASFADFEMRAYAASEAGEALTKESLNNIYADVFEEFYGDAVNAHSLNDSEWSRIPHFMSTNNFYVYQYATSQAAATALAKMIIEEGEPARERFLTLLKSGSNDYPIELLKKAGIDMTTPQPIYDTIEVFDALVDELEKTLAEGA